MLISCEQCSTTYTLDDSLIPPQGAQVQCTKCNHVFTARASAQPQAVPEFSTKPASSTMVFGSPAAQQPQRGGGASNQTMVFGSPAQVSGAAPEAARGGSQTMVFGASPFAQNAPAAAGSSPKSTMMFGAPGQSAGAPDLGSVPTESGAPGGNRSTMMFGSPVQAAPAPAADAPRPASQTMVFGSSPFAQQPAAAEPSAGGGSPKNTMMFGAPAAAAAPTPQAQAPAGGSSKQTMVFGAPAQVAAAADASAGGSSKNTMMFGAPPVAAQAAAAQAAAPAQPAAPAGGSKQTMVFGAPAQQAAAAAPAAPASGTMIFGAPPAAVAAAAQASSGAAPSPKSTMMFGAPGQASASAGNDSAPATAAGGSKQTMVFGAAAAVPAAFTEPTPMTPAAASRTMVFGAPAAQDASANQTIIFGGGGAAESKPPQDAGPHSAGPHSAGPKGTMVFGNPLAQGAPANAPASGPMKMTEERQNKTQLYAQASPVGSKETAPDLDAVSMNEATTLPPDSFAHAAQSVANANARHDALATAQAAARATGTPTQPLPPMAPVKSSSSGIRHSAVAAVPDERELEAFANSAKQRNRIALIAVGVIALLIVLAVVWNVVSGGRAAAPSVPPEAKQEAEKAIAQLKFDDSQSQADAMKTLQGLVTQHPTMVEAHEGMVMALALQVDDLRQRTERVGKHTEKVRKAIDEKSPQGAARINELTAEYNKLAAQLTPIQTKLTEAYRTFDRLVAGTEASSPLADGIARTRIFAKSVLGESSALPMLADFKKSGKNDEWVTISMAEYVLNDSKSTTDQKAEALSSLAALKEANAQAVRAYVLAARIHLSKNDRGAAEAELDKVIALRKDHDVAQELKSWMTKNKD